MPNDFDTAPSGTFTTTTTAATTDSSNEWAVPTPVAFQSLSPEEQEMRRVQEYDAMEERRLAAEEEIRLANIAMRDKGCTIGFSCETCVHFKEGAMDQYGGHSLPCCRLWHTY